MNQTFIASMTGYKATNADMTCKGHQFELGKWYEVEAVKMCKKGFHFCVHPSGVYAYYNDAGDRVFKCEAEQVFEVPTEAGADFKLVAKRIRLVEEITPGTKSKTNTGNRNTGNRNTGNRNTGYGNIGDCNTGHRNIGDCNTGHRNTGYGNIGDCNTGHRNTGDCNTGDRNTGDRNTGSWNACDYSSGFFCAIEPKVISFDVQTNLTREQFLKKYPEATRLGRLLSENEPIKLADCKRIPGITAKKLLALHSKHLAARKLIK